MTSRTEILRQLFPSPVFLNSRLSPKPLPGRTPESTVVLRNTLIDNHEKFHCFFNDAGFHNHTSHDLLTKYWLGADAGPLNASYEEDKKTQRAAFKSPSEVAHDTIFDHVGKPKYYDAYKQFFTNAVLSKGAAQTLQDYVFSNTSNFVSPNNEPQMVARFFGGLFHSMIQVGYGFEFGMPGMVVEGLAQTYVTKAVDMAPMVPQSLFESSKSLDSTSPEMHAFTIISKICQDSRFDGLEKTHPTGMFQPTVAKYGDIIHDHAKAWTVDITKEGELERKIEELIYTAVILYTIAGSQQGRPFDADFFFMHLVTASIFLPSISIHLNPTSQELLLRVYFTFVIAWWISRGRPIPDIKSFYSQPKNEQNSDLWFSYIVATRAHPDIHLCKIQRTFSHYSSLYGGRERGETDFEETELEGAELLDGNLFLRATAMTNEVMERQELWGRDGFYAETKL